MIQRTPDPASYLVDMEPVGRRTKIPQGDTLLEAAQSAGVGLVSLCGREHCAFKVTEGPPPTPIQAITTQ